MWLCLFQEWRYGAKISEKLPKVLLMPQGNRIKI